MMPADDRARAGVVSRFHDTRLEPVLRSFGQVAPSGRDATFIAETGALLGNWTGLPPLPRQRLLTGKHLAIADCGFVASFGILDLLRELLDLEVVLPHPIATYASALAAQGSVTERIATAGR